MYRESAAEILVDKYELNRIRSIYNSQLVNLTICRFLTKREVSLDRRAKLKRYVKLPDPSFGMPKCIRTGFGPRKTFCPSESTIENLAFSFSKIEPFWFVFLIIMQTFPKLLGKL